MPIKLFRDYSDEAVQWITSQERPFYPDYLEDAVALYKETMKVFGELAQSADSSEQLLARIHEQSGEPRIQLLRMFRKYVSPMTAVEMLKVKNKASEVIAQFGPSFRDLPTVRTLLASRPVPDEALAAVFWEHHDRGTPGYVLTAHFFDTLKAQFGDEFIVQGPREAGADVQLDTVLPHFRSVVPADFIIFRASDKLPLVVGFAHYDSDRGGSQEDDRTGGNQDKVEKIMSYAARRRMPLRVLFVNDGPGLLLGSMWADYARLEADNIIDGELRVMVVTLRQIPQRLTRDWILGAD